MNNQINNLQLRIRDREKVLFEGVIASLTSENKVGTFDVLARHTNFIALLDEKLILRHMDGREEEMVIEQGVMRVEANKIQVYLGI